MAANLEIPYQRHWTSQGMRWPLPWINMTGNLIKATWYSVQNFGMKTSKIKKEPLCIQTRLRLKILSVSCAIFTCGLKFLAIGSFCRSIHPREWPRWSIIEIPSPDRLPTKFYSVPSMTINYMQQQVLWWRSFEERGATS